MASVAVDRIAPSSRLQWLTISRAVAALTVVVMHLAGGTPGWQGLLSCGLLAVPWFFTLSGYVLAHVYLRSRDVSPHLGEYVLARAARIHPAYMLAWLASVVLWPALSHYGLSADVARGAADVLLLQGWIPSWSVRFNDPAWSVSCEVFYYGLFPLLLAIACRLDRPRALLGCLLVATWGLGWATNGVWILSSRPIDHLPKFVAGVLACAAVRDGWRPGLMLSTAACLAVLIAWLPVATRGTDGLFLINGGALAGPFALLVAAIATVRSTVPRRLTGAILAGEVSYGFYIYQAPVGVLQGRILGVPVDGHWSATFVGLNVALLFAVAWLSWQFLERPIVAWAKGRRSPAEIPRPQLFRRHGESEGRSHAWSVQQ